MRRTFVLAALLPVVGCDEAPRLSWDGEVFRAHGWRGDPPPAGWPSVFHVRAGENPDAPDVLGDYRLRGGTVTFKPRFKPAPGVRLHAEYLPEGGGIVTLTAGEKLRASPSTTRVVGVYPGAGMWPANILKIYIEFSAPMRRGEAWEHVRILDDRGQVVRAFVELDQELWDERSQRLTILFDPGRLKRGLGDNLAMGAPLQPGRTYQLVIDKAWRDANGAPLSDFHTRRFTVGDPVRQRLDISGWRVTPPAGELDPVVIDFPRPMDYGLLDNTFSVWKDGRPVDGQNARGENETRWGMKPFKPWTPGDYEIRVESIVEDLASNRMDRPFDIDSANPAQSRRAGAPSVLKFRVG